jgi:NADPH-dependent 2,4-dienoyl-CoA reductase/sulfur reductase-like enzyme
MERCKYLIVGGGVAADAAVRGIREIDRTGSILVVSDEDDPPYDRPPLSKALWRGTAVDAIWRHTASAGAELRLGAPIVALDPSDRTATDSRKNVFTYEKLLLATGGSPRRLPDVDSSVIHFRRFSDFKRAWQSSAEGADFAVIGGGFIGPEIAASLAMNGRSVSLIFPGACIGDRLYPRPLAHFLNVYFRKHGVDVHFDERVEHVERHGGKLVVCINGASRLAVDSVIAGIGIEPNVGLARTAGLKVEGGVAVDETLRTGDPHIFAAGDVASFPCAALGRRLRFEHEDNARAMGQTAGRNMAGVHETYRHVPSFYSDLFDLGYEAVGEIDSAMQTVADWERKFHKGVIYYLKDRRVRGVLLWNVRGLVDAARELIAAQHELEPGDLIGRLRP